MVLHHVAQRAGALIVAGAGADAFFLGHRDLHVVDILGVPQGFEDRVAEAHDQDVLHGLLAEVMVDPEDLALVEVGAQHVVDMAGARQVSSDRLLDDDARKRVAGADRLHQPGGIQLLDAGLDH